ncbi:MAG TPA: GNAT family N-acetyltransferase [Thermodesulfobacteriota bacterium]|nr:GNAT family N-acetyltransferase [Thermodesulfobacteriota bacterium]
MTGDSTGIIVRNTRPEDFQEILELSLKVYPDFPPWAEWHLKSHLRVFPQGQLVAVESKSGKIVGMAASLIILWDDYDIKGSWREFTDNGMFTNHDPKGRTLYGAEVMVHPSMQRRGIGKKIYQARRDLTQRLGLLRIRAGGRVNGYFKYAEEMSAEEYVKRVIDGKLKDPTLSFQLKEGFSVLAVVPDYLPHDKESLGYAAIIEWINPQVAKPEDYSGSLSLTFNKPASSQ